MALEDDAVKDLAVMSPPDLFSRDSWSVSNMARSQADVGSPERDSEGKTRWRRLRSLRRSFRVGNGRWTSKHGSSRMKERMMRSSANPAENLFAGTVV